MQRPIWFMVSLLYFNTTLAQEVSHRTFETILEEADKAREEGDLEKVLSLLQEAYNMKPLPELLNNIGRTLEDLGRYGEAIDAYKKVADTPGVDPSLRALDAARMAALQPKIGKAWVLPKVVPMNTEILIDGKPPAAPPGKEFPVDPGPHLYQFTIPMNNETVIRILEFPVDRRSILNLDVRTSTKEEGRLALKGGKVLFKKVMIEGREIVGDLNKIDAIRLVAGIYKVQVVTTEDETHNLEVKVEAGRFPKLASFVPEKVKQDVTVTKQKPGFTLPTIWQWVAIGGGIALVGMGAGLMIWAEKDRDPLENMTTDQRGVVTSITYAEAKDIESKANRKTMAGLVLTGVGIASIAGGVTWWLLTKDKPSKGLSLMPKVDGIYIIGRF